MTLREVISRIVHPGPGLDPALLDETRGLMQRNTELLERVLSQLPEPTVDEALVLRIVESLEPSGKKRRA